MRGQFRAIVLCTSLAIPLLGAAFAAQPKPAPQAPVPSQIATAKKVFLANAGGDEPFYDEPIFTGGPNRGYNQFFAALKASGKYELVGTPADADLLFEIQFVAPPVEKQNLNEATLGRIIPFDPQFRLVIRDPRSTALLWAFTEHVQWAILQGNRDKNFDLALGRIVNDLQALSTLADNANKP